MPQTVSLADACEKFRWPNTRFNALQIAEEDMADKVVLQAICTSDDNFAPGETFEVCRVRIVDAYYGSFSEAFEVLRDLVHYLAAHEADECIEVCIDGTWTKLYNPHATHGLRTVVTP